MSVRNVSFLMYGLSVSAWACGTSDDNGARLDNVGNASAFDAGGVVDGSAALPPYVLPTTNTTPTTSPAGGDNCLVQPIDTKGQSPDMLIVLDQSLSMTLGLRWGPSTDAVKSLTKQYDSTIQFGLSIFPGDGFCGAGKLNVPVGPMNAAAIASPSVKL